jgi:hypothetical protein
MEQVVRGGLAGLAMPAISYRGLSSARGSDISSASPQERAAEKERLQCLVKEFGRRATRGVRCGFVNLATGLVTTATYRVDKRLEKFIVKVNKEEDELICDLTQIQEVQTVEDARSLPPKVASVLDQDTLARLCVIKYNLKHGQPTQICLLEGSPEEAETFHTCLMILRIYSAQRQREQGGA